MTEPLQFVPILKRLRWGGRRLGTELHKPIGEGTGYAESWEVSDHGDDQSVVASGADKGWTLSRLVRERGAELLGRHTGLARFPLLIKYLDACDRLSVQVHPDDARARAMRPDESGKTEAWVILDARPGSVIYAGLNAGVTRERLAAAIDGGTVEECLHRVPAIPGDCFFIPAGTVHAIGEGVLLAEVQQTSDVTYRLFDWNRTGADGRPRALHIAESLACTNYHQGPVFPVVPRFCSGAPGHRVEELIACPYFTILRHLADAPLSLPADDRCHILMGLEGEARVGGMDSAAILERGSTWLVPAAALPLGLTPAGPSQFLEVFWE